MDVYMPDLVDFGKCKFSNKIRKPTKPYQFVFFLEIMADTAVHA